MSNGSTHNIFEQNEPLIVDAVVHANGQRNVVGKARLTTDDEGNMEIDLDIDMKHPLSKTFVNNLDPLSVHPRDADISVVHPDDPAHLPKHAHNPVQHRDGKPPWCNFCGLTVGYLKPQSRIPKN